MTNDEPEEEEEEEEDDDGADELEPCPNVHIDVDDPSVRGEYGMVVLEEEDILAVAGLNSEDFSEDFGPVDVATVQDESTVASAVRIHILPVDGEERGWLEWIRQVDEDLATAIERYLNDCVSGMQQPVLPKPNGQIDVQFKDKFDIDLFVWLGSYSKRDNNNEKKIGVIGKKRPSDGKKVKRGPYKCRVCGDMQKRDGKPHACRPTRDQVVDEIILQLSGKGKRRAVHDGNANKRKRQNLCGKCHHLKTECNCLDEYGRIARVVRGLTSYTGGDNLQQDRDVIGTEIDNSMDFKFSEVDGRRNPVDYDASITTTFVDDHAPADAGLQDGDPVDVGFSHRPLPPQAFLHMDQLRQGEASSQVSASRCGFQRNISLQGMAPSCFCFSSAIHTGQP